MLHGILRNFEKRKQYTLLSIKKLYWKLKQNEQCTFIFFHQNIRIIKHKLILSRVVQTTSSSSCGSPLWGSGLLVITLHLVLSVDISKSISLLSSLTWSFNPFLCLIFFFFPISFLFAQIIETWFHILTAMEKVSYHGKDIS